MFANNFVNTCKLNNSFKILFIACTAAYCCVKLVHRTGLLSLYTFVAKNTSTIKQVGYSICKQDLTGTQYLVLHFVTLSFCLVQNTDVTAVIHCPFNCQFMF